MSGVTTLFVVIGCLHASNDSKQAWHDQWSGTAVYRRQRIQPRGFPISTLENHA